MQYTQIVPNTKTDLSRQIFTYKIPPEILPTLQIGSLVEIPFNNRKIEGIVVDFQKSKKGLEEKKIKKISRVLDNKALDESHLKLAKWMAEYYFAPLSLCLFEMLALPLKKQQKAAEEQYFEKTNPSYSLDALFVLIRKVISKQKQIICLFPNLIEAKKAFSFFNEHNVKSLLYYGGLNKDALYRAYQKIKEGKIDLVIGSHKALFAPLPHIGLIVIFNEHDETYKNDRNPRYHAVKVAQKLAQINNNKLVLISSTPDITDYFHFQKKKNQNTFFIHPQEKTSIKTQIIAMQNEHKRGNYSLLSETLQYLIKKNYKQNKKTLLFASRRGASSYIFCKECGYTFSCPNCELPLTYNIIPLRQHFLYCHHCSYKIPLPTLCPKCNSMMIKFSGTGTQKIEAEIKKILPCPKIFRLDQDTKTIPQDYKKSEIIIGTQKIFNFWTEPVDLTAVINADNILNIPDFRQGEKFFQLFHNLRHLTQNLFLIQTYQAENPTLQNALARNFANYYQKELNIRKELQFPPYCRLIRLVCQHKDEKRCQKETEEVATKLKSYIEILGPSFCFYRKIRNKFRWQIVIKTQRLKVKTQILQIIHTLPDYFIIDVDPITLL